MTDLERLRAEYPEHVDAALTLASVYDVHPDAVAKQVWILAWAGAPKPLLVLQHHLSEEPDFLRKCEAKMEIGKPIQKLG